MKRYSLILASALWVLLLLLHCNQSAVAAKDTWTSVHSQNFFLVGNASEKEIKQVATRLEQFREVFSRLFPRLNFASPVPTTVIVFKSDSSYKPFKPIADGKVVEVSGYFQGGHDLNYITLTTEKRDENAYSTIFHEYVHLLVNNSLGRANVPPWFNEGLAEYYSTFDIQDGQKVFLGNPISHHLQLLRSAHLLPLKTLFAVDYYSLERNKHETRGLFYAESWALVHYLIQGNEGKHLPKLSRFLDLLLKNTAVETALRDALQTDYAGLEKELKAYIQRSAYRINVATFEKKLEFDSQLQTAPLTDAEAQAYLGDLLYHTQRAEDASAKLQQALLLDPNLPIAHASLGMVRMAQKNFVEAKQHLAKAVEGNSQSYLAHYYYAFALSREGMTEGELVAGYPAETAHLMRTELQKAIELNPGYPESYHLLAFVNLVTDQNLDESIQLIKKALALSPGSEEYLFVLTQVYLHKQDFEAARKVVEPLSVNSSDPRIRATAESLLKSISAIQEQMARARAEHEKAGQRSGPGNFVTQVGSISTTSDRNVAEPVDPSSYLQEALKAPAAGEVRMQGVLTQIDCGPKGIVFTISVGDTLLKLQTKSFDDIDITTFSTEVGGEITCGVRKIKNAVVVCYLPSKDARSKTDGIAKSIDFVPPDFKLSGKQ